MEFCGKCGSRMIKTEKGFQCPKCGKTIYAKAAMQMKNERKKDQTDGIFVYAKQEETYTRMRRECPECGNKEAMHWFSGISGEHAGIMRERTVEHLKCTKCSHTWTENS